VSAPSRRRDPLCRHVAPSPGLVNGLPELDSNNGIPVPDRLLMMDELPGMVNDRKGQIPDNISDKTL